MRNLTETELKIKRTISTLCLLVSFLAGCTPVDAPEPEMPRTRLIGWDETKRSWDYTAHYRLHFNVDSTVSRLISYYGFDSTMPNFEWLFSYNDEKLVSEMLMYSHGTLRTRDVYQYNNHKLIKRQGYVKGGDTVLLKGPYDTLIYGTDGKLKTLYLIEEFAPSLEYYAFEWDESNLIGHKEYTVSSMADSLPKLLSSYSYAYYQQPNLVAALLGNNTYGIYKRGSYYLFSSNNVAEERKTYGILPHLYQYRYNTDSTGRLKESYLILIRDGRIPDTIKSVYIYE